MISDFNTIIDGINIVHPKCDSGRYCRLSIASLHAYFEIVYGLVNNAYVSLDEVTAKQNYPPYLKKIKEIELQKDECLSCNLRYTK